MNNVVININGTPRENDILVFKNGAFQPISKESYLASYINETRKENQNLRASVKKLQQDLVSLAKIIKEKN